MKLVDGKIAVLTGAAKGIGKAAASSLSENGAKGIVIADLDIDTAQQTVVEIAEKTARSAWLLNVMSRRRMKLKPFLQMYWKSSVRSIFSLTARESAAYSI